MSLTISELESERAKILEEIESKAQSISSKSNSGENHSLKDWLRAAEEVMPTSEPVREKQDMGKIETRSNYTNQMSKPAKNKASFFGVIIMLSLLLTLLGVLYIAYTSLHKELQSILGANQLNEDKINQLQLDMDTLQKSLSSGGKVALFISLEDKVLALESQVLALQTPLKTNVAKDKSTDSTLLQVGTTSENIATKVAIDSNKVVTEAVLDLKLSQLEQKIDQKLQTILDYLSSGKKVSPIVSMASQLELPSANHQAVDMTVSEPTITETKLPTIKQPLVTLVQTIAEPTIPASPKQVKEPIENYTADVKWLMNEPGLHYTLQLASMPEQQSVEAMVRKLNLKDAKVIPQLRNNMTNYILLTGSFADRKAADDFSRKFKAEFGISPWVRKVKDITARVK